VCRFNLDDSNSTNNFNIIFNIFLIYLSVSIYHQGRRRSRTRARLESSTLRSTIRESGTRWLVACIIDDDETLLRAGVPFRGVEKEKEISNPTSMSAP